MERKARGRVGTWHKLTGTWQRVRGYREDLGKELLMTGKLGRACTGKECASAFRKRFALWEDNF